MKKHFPKLIDIPYMPLSIRMIDLHHPPYKQGDPEGSWKGFWNLSLLLHIPKRVFHAHCL